MSIWKEGKYVDTWAVTHFLWGVIFAWWLQLVGLSVGPASVIYLIGAIVWEIVEVKIAKEHIYNKIIDVIIGLVGFFLFHMVPWSTKAMIALTFASVVIEIHGYLNYKNRIK